MLSREELKFWFAIMSSIVGGVIMTVSMFLRMEKNFEIAIVQVQAKVQSVEERVVRIEALVNDMHQIHGGSHAPTEHSIARR